MTQVIKEDLKESQAMPLCIFTGIFFLTRLYINELRESVCHSVFTQMWNAITLKETQLLI